MKRMPKSVRKFIRREKARIRREVLDIRKQEKLINELYQKICEKFKTKKTADAKNAAAPNALAQKNEDK